MEPFKHSSNNYYPIFNTPNRLIDSKDTKLLEQNETILSTPYPRATSTVTKNYLLENPSTRENSIHSKSTSESSLGLLDNLSSLVDDLTGIEEPEHVAARKLLQRCSASDVSLFSSGNKENNAYVRTFEKKPPPSATEITARSTGLSYDKNFMNDFGIGKDSGDFLGQLQNEEFQSGSQMSSILSAAEKSCEHENLFKNPATKYLDLSCFSGIIGDLDLSIQSTTRRKIPVQDYFLRNCSDIGQTLGDGYHRPNLGLCTDSPKRSKNFPLVDSSSDASSMDHRVEADSVMSLSAIAQALKNTDDDTPRKLVDQLLLARKNDKLKKLVGKTYTVPERSSIDSQSSTKLSLLENINEVVADSTRKSSLGKLISVEHAEEICPCVVNVTRNFNVNISNRSDRWLMTKIKLIENEENNDNLEVRLPNEILINPNTMESVKIGVKVRKIIPNVMLFLNVAATDVITRLEDRVNTVRCLKPEELNVKVITPSGTKILDFKYEEKLITIKIVNNNTVDIPVAIRILNDGPNVFRLNCENLLLESYKECSVNVQFDETQDLGERYQGKLLIGLLENPDRVIEELKLIGEMKIYEIKLIDTKLPIIIKEKESKIVTVVNSGTMATSVDATVIDGDDFSVKPSNRFLQSNEKGYFEIFYNPYSFTVHDRNVKLKLTVGSNFYEYTIVGEKRSKISTPDICGRSSPCSSVSGSTVVGDGIPIRATRASLNWNSIKVGKHDTKEFTIRNTSYNKIKIHAVIHDENKNFMFLKERQPAGTNLLFTLQRMESKSLSVTFSPHKPGAMSGKIIFKHHEPIRDSIESRPSKMIFLYGYGGSGKIEISETSKDISNKMWLSLGTMNETGLLRGKIKLQNNGDLFAYAKVKLTPKAFYPNMIMSWSVNPSEMLLRPKEIIWITIEFRPKKQDLILLEHNNVSHMGTISIIHGDEPTRWRIRRLYNKMKETGQLNGKHNDLFRNIVYPICKIFPREQLVQDLNTIRDSIQNLSELCQGVNQHEIMLTMEIPQDETFSVFEDNVNDSQMFYSLFSNDSQLCEPNEQSFFPSKTVIEDRETTFHQEISKEYFSVTPSSITLSPPTITEKTVTISCAARVAQPFETLLSNVELLSVIPAEGMIPPGRPFPLRISCKRRTDRDFEAILTICTNGDKQQVKVKVIV